MYQTIKASCLKVKETKSVTLLNSHSVYEYAKDIKSLAQETVHVITLNAKNKIIDRHMISLGTAISAYFQPREAFRCAILDNAVSVIFVHNHPSGDTDPSHEDREVTKKMFEVGELLGIRVLDHIIIGDNYFSFADTVGLVNL